MIGGNMILELQKSVPSTNKIGEKTKEWTQVQSIKGWLDLAGGESKYSTYLSKIQESTHVFISDYTKILVSAEEARAVDSDGVVYDVMLIDDPMNLHNQIEIYLKYLGGQ